MVNINEFCERLVSDFTGYFRSKQSLHLLTQDKSSCKAIVKACLEIEPDYVLDIGTNYGLSTLSLAYAFTILGKDLSGITTTDVDHRHWLEETPAIQRGLLLNSGIDVSKIARVHEDFIKLEPESMVRRGKVLVFYDIHDTSTVSYMEKFLGKWIPAFDYGYVMVHDCYLPKSAYWIDRNNPVYPVSSATHFSGISFEGYKECATLVEWLNTGKRSIYAVPGTSIVRFTI